MRAVHVAVREWSCARARRALSLVLDGEDAEGDVQSLAVHFGSCRTCREFAREVSAFTDHLRQPPKGDDHGHPLG